MLKKPFRHIKDFIKESLYRNSLYLIIDSVLLAGTGFLFWIVATRIYSSEDVGLAAAMISAVGLIGLISMLGLDYSLVRFLGNAGDKARSLLNSCISIGTITAVICASVFIIGIGWWSPDLKVIQDNWLIILVFVSASVSMVLASYVQQVYVANRKSVYVLIQQGLLFGVGRFIPLFILAMFYKNFGIFMAYGIGLTFASTIGLIYFTRRIYKDYRYSPMIKFNQIRDMGNFPITNYLSGLFWTMPNSILPLIVIGVLGAVQNAYFYIAWAIGNVLLIVPASISYSLLAEGSYDNDRLTKDTTRSLKLIYSFLLPVVVIIMLFGDKLLGVFGLEYSQNSLTLLYVLCVSSLPFALNNIYFSVKRVLKQMWWVVGMSISIVFVTIALSLYLMPIYGINGVGYAWLIAHSLAAIIHLYLLVRLVKNES